MNPDRIKKLVTDAIAQQKPTAWFESLYDSAQGDANQIPWAKLQPHPLLQQWLEDNQPDGVNKKALVIGCGLGDDAEILPKFGFQVTAFDVSETAIAWCQQRFPNSSVNYTVADLLALPANWVEAFDLVVEVRTIQSLPVEMREDVFKAIAPLIKPGGRLLLIANLRGENEPIKGPPWALSQSELQTLTECNLEQIELTEEASLVRLLYTKSYI